MLKKPMEVIEHSMSCNCNRRREWIDVDGKLIAIEFSVADKNEPPMTDEEKQKMAQIIKMGQEQLKNKKSK